MFPFDQIHLIPFFIWPIIILYIIIFIIGSVFLSFFVLRITFGNIRILDESNESRFLNAIKKIQFEKWNTISDKANLKIIPSSIFSFGNIKAFSGFFNAAGKFVGVSYLQVKGGLLDMAGQKLNGKFSYRDSVREFMVDIADGTCVISSNSQKLVTVDIPKRNILDNQNKVIANLEIPSFNISAPFVNTYWKIIENNGIVCKMYASRNDLELYKRQLSSLFKKFKYLGNLSDIYKETDENILSEKMRDFFSNPEFSKKAGLSLFEINIIKAENYPLSLASIFLANLSYLIFFSR